jgi:hypothetical protein
MAEKIKIEKKGMLEKEDIVPSAEIKLKDKLGDRVAFAPGTVAEMSRRRL